MVRFLTNLFALSVLLISLEGCSTQELPESWRPLTTVVERGDLPGVGHGVVTTISPYLFTSDLDWFNERYPEGSVDHESLRGHERTHALEQEEFIGDATGARRAAKMSRWVQKYLTDKSFRWAVEQRGYKVDILYERAHGIRVIPEVYARILSGKTYNSMVSYDEALQWVRDVLGGRA
jgi:hypothetical protein